MKAIEKDFWIKVQQAFGDGKSLKILESERKLATEFVAKEKCFWSVDYDHVMAYEADHSILTTGIG